MEKLSDEPRYWLMVEKAVASGRRPVRFSFGQVCGICACSGGIFHDCYNVIGGVDQAIPVDVYAPGCAIRPETIIDAVVEGIGVLEEKRAKLAEARKGA